MRTAASSHELYRAFPRKGKKAHWDADSGVIWDLRSPALRTPGWTSADAAGLPIFPGLVRYDEAASGSIDHAIRVTFSSTRDAWINPASHCAGDTSNPAAPAMGARLRLGAALRHLGDERPRPRHRHGAQALRDDRRRQRVQLVLLGDLRQAAGTTRT